MLRQMAVSCLLMVGENEQCPLGSTRPSLGSGGFCLGLRLPAKVND